MSEYWVSRDKYYCKYCNVFIADDKPSRLHHDSGLRHKGNYDRFIRDIYKKGAQEIKDKAEEAREVARMDAAAHAAMLASGESLPSTSSLPPPPPPKKPRATTSSDPFANYTTAADLGFVDPDAERLSSESLAKETRQSESLIGGWQRVVHPPKMMTKEDEMRKAEREERDREELEMKEREKRKMAKYLVEKSAFGEDDADFDPTKVELKLKRKRLTLKEEDEEKEKERIKKEEDDAAEEERTKRRVMKKAAWEEVQVTDEGLLMFDEPVQPDVKAEEGTVGDVKPKLEDGDDGPKPTPSLGGDGFKKRKMLGASAVRKK